MHRTTLEERMRSTLRHTDERHTHDGERHTHEERPSTMRSTGTLRETRETEGALLRSTLDANGRESPRPAWRNLASPFSGFRARREDVSENEE